MTAGARVLGRTTSVWLAAAAAVLAAIAAGAAPPPPGLADTERAAPFDLCRARFGAIVALAILRSCSSCGAPDGASGSRSRRRAGLGIAAYSAGGYAQRACTAHYAGKVVVIGTEWTTLGETYSRGNPGLSTDDLLFDAAGVLRPPVDAGLDRPLPHVHRHDLLPVDSVLDVCLIATVQAMPSGTLPAVLRDDSTPLPPAGRRADPFDAFISYRHGGLDAEVARQLLRGARGGRLFGRDRRARLPGERELPAEMAALYPRAGCTVAVISKRYLESGNTQEEAIISKVLDLGDRKRRLIPLVIEPVAMPAWLYGIVGIDFTKPDPIVDPFDKLKTTIGPPLVRT